MATRLSSHFTRQLGTRVAFCFFRWIIVRKIYGLEVRDTGTKKNWLSSTVFLLNFDEWMVDTLRIGKMVLNSKNIELQFSCLKKRKKLVSCLWAIFMQKVFSSFTSSPPWSFQKLILVLLGVLQINFRLWKVLHLLDLYFFPRVAAAGEKEHKKLIHLNSPETMHFINEFCYYQERNTTTHKTRYS